MLCSIINRTISHRFNRIPINWHQRALLKRRDKRERRRKRILNKFKFIRSTTFFTSSPTSHFIPNMEIASSIKYISWAVFYVSAAVSNSREVLLVLELTVQAMAIIPLHWREANYRSGSIVCQFKLFIPSIFVAGTLVQRTQIVAVSMKSIRK